MKLKYDEKNKDKKKKKLINYNKIVYLIIIVLMIPFMYKGYKYFEVWQEIREVKKQEELLIKENQLLKKENRELETLEEIEEIARDSLGLVKKDEVPYIR